MTTISGNALAYFKLMDPDKVYGIDIPRDIANELIDAGLVQWVPSTSWSGEIYGLTEKGLVAYRARKLAE